MDVDFTAGKFSLSLDKPIVEQAGVTTAKTQGTPTEIRFTEGKGSAEGQTLKIEYKNLHFILAEARVQYGCTLQKRVFVLSGAVSLIFNLSAH